MSRCKYTIFFSFKEILGWGFLNIIDKGKVREAQQ
jgi:hypothetical protein